MRVISIANFKGGTGKTATACNLAALLAREDKRVLLIDADAQHNSTDFFIKDHDGITLTDVLEGLGEATASDNVTPADGYAIDLLPADAGLLKLDLAAILNQANAPLKRFDDLIDCFRQDGDYDFILCDCPPQFSAASVASLINSDEVIMPTQVDAFSARGVSELAEQISRAGIRLLRPMPRIRVLVTMARRSKLYTQGEDMLRRSGFEVFRTVIRSGVAVGESSYARQALFEYAPSSRPAQDYEALLREILGEADTSSAAAAAPSPQGEGRRRAVEDAGPYGEERRADEGIGPYGEERRTADSRPYEEEREVLANG